MFYFDDFYGKKILKSTLLKDYDCFFTTKDFVLTSSDLKELESEAENNRNFLKQKLSCNEIITAKQVHSDNIKIIKENEFFYDNTDALICPSKFRDKERKRNLGVVTLKSEQPCGCEEPAQGCDTGLDSNKKNSVLLMNFADCVPIILYSKIDNTGAVVHAGWRGSALEIAKKTVEKMNTELNIKSENITALIGPAIGKCCFETDENVFNQLIKDKTQTDLYNKIGKKYFIDLKLLNYKQLALAGVKNIDICSYCTFCMSDIFFSYRKEKGKTARHSAIIKIKGENICQ